MDDYSALAQRISVSVSGVSGALILSRDGLVLGAYPNEDESLAKPAWLRFITLGEPDKSFVEFPDQVWAYVKRGPVRGLRDRRALALAPACSSIRWSRRCSSPRRSRSRRDTLRVPDANAAPSGKPRTSLHPQPGKPVPAEVAVEPAAGAMAERASEPERPAEHARASEPARPGEPARPAAGRRRRPGRLR